MVRAFMGGKKRNIIRLWHFEDNLLDEVAGEVIRTGERTNVYGNGVKEKAIYVESTLRNTITYNTLEKWNIECFFNIPKEGTYNKQLLCLFNSTGKSLYIFYQNNTVSISYRRAAGVSWTRVNVYAGWNLGEWYKVNLKNNGQSLTININDTLCYTVPFSIMLENSKAFIVGQYDASSSEDLKSYVDELCIYTDK